MRVGHEARWPTRMDGSAKVDKRAVRTGGIVRGAREQGEMYMNCLCQDAM